VEVLLIRGAAGEPVDRSPPQRASVLLPLWWRPKGGRIGRFPPREPLPVDLEERPYDIGRLGCLPALRFGNGLVATRARDRYPVEQRELILIAKAGHRDRMAQASPPVKRRALRFALSGAERRN
jgi:hypothetical protein